MALGTGEMAQQLWALAVESWSPEFRFQHTGQAGYPTKPAPMAWASSNFGADLCDNTPTCPYTHIQINE